MTSTTYSRITGPLTPQRAEQLITRLSDALLKLEEIQSSADNPATVEGQGTSGKAWSGWDWSQGVALTALYQHSLVDPSSEGGQKAKRLVTEWYINQFKLTEGKGPTKTPGTMAPAYALASVLADRSEFGAGADWMRWCKEWGDWVVDEAPRTQEGGIAHAVAGKEQLSAETLLFTVLPLARIGILLDRPELVSEAAFQFLLHLRYLSDQITGLWYHGWQFGVNPTQHGHGPHFAQAFWARSNAWVIYTIPLFLETVGDLLPEDDSTRRLLINEYRRQVEALKGLQDTRSGLWHAVLNDETTELEASATAGIAAGIFAGVRNRWLKARLYIPMANSALVGVIESILPSGEVARVVEDTPISIDMEVYREAKLAPNLCGQAMAIAALSEWQSLMSPNSGPKSSASSRSLASQQSPMSPMSPVSPFTAKTAAPPPAEEAEMNPTKALIVKPDESVVPATSVDDTTANPTKSATNAETAITSGDDAHLKVNQDKVRDGASTPSSMNLGPEIATALVN